MPKYVFAYHGGSVPETAAAQAEAMAAWGTWFETLGDVVIDGGNPTSQSKTVAANGSVSNGGGANPLSGYSLISAASIDDAVKHAKGCPILKVGGSVEVAEAIDM
jgi:hypothetical protein